MRITLFVHDALFSGVSMNGLNDDPDSISLSIGDALMHRRSEGG